MKFKESLGIDVSKKTIDVALHIKKANHQFPNSVNGFKSLIKWVVKQTDLEIGQVLICFEHTGIYSLPLASFLNEKKIFFSMVPAIEIKRSMGLVRGKNDMIDAQRIAEYAYLRREQIKEYVMPSKNVLHLQKLVSLRDKLVKQKAGYMSDLKECKAMLSMNEYRSIYAVQKKIITCLSDQILTLEKQMKQLISSDEMMNKIYLLITSVHGIGMVLAVNFIVYTNCFISFQESRKFACYAGIAPFERQSGTSLNSKSRVSQLGNKKMKSLLNMAAFVAVQVDPELKLYYNKRVEKGKSKMSSMNIIRNKIVHRVFAVIKRGTPFVTLQNHAA